VEKSRPSRRCRRAIRAPRVAAFGLALGAVACGAAPPAIVTSVVLPDAARQPDGVVLEESPAIPEVSERAPARGVVALRAPLGGGAVLTIVHRLFRGFTHGGIEALEPLLTDDATILGSGRGRAPLVEQWRTRLKNLDYGRLSVSAIVEDDQIERFDFDDLDLPGAPERPATMREGDALVRFPIATPRVGSEKLFGDEITLLLRRDGASFKIAGFGEVNGP
jgi:hypothetical protein